MYEEYELQTTESDREIMLMRLHDELQDEVESAYEDCGYYGQK